MATSDSSVHVVTSKIIIDVFLVLAALGIIAVFELHGLDPVHRGFFCNDPDLQYPLIEQTFSSTVIFITAGSIPIAVILFCEFFIHLNNKRRLTIKQSNGLPPPTDICYQAFGRRVHAYVASSYKHVGALVFAAAIAQVACDLMKYSIGRLRPHFLAACVPDWSSFNCTDARGMYTYITTINCTSTDEWVVLESRLSFPSGHATFSSACFTYLIMYLQFRMTWRRSQLLKHFIQAVIFYFTIYVCTTRVANYYHYPSDVLAGAALGSLVSIAVARFVDDMSPRVRTDRVLRQVQSEVNVMMQTYQRTDSTNTYETGLSVWM